VKSIEPGGLYYCQLADDDLSCDASHEVSPGPFRELSRGSSFGVSCEVSHGPSHELSHEVSRDPSREILCGVGHDLPRRRRGGARD
jgi:hypothetical protein